MAKLQCWLSSSAEVCVLGMQPALIRPTLCLGRCLAAALLCGWEALRLPSMMTTYMW